MMERPVFWDYITVDADGELNGITEDAPEEARKAYAEYLAQESEYKKAGIKV